MRSSAGRVRYRGSFEPRSTADRTTVSSASGSMADRPTDSTRGMEPAFSSILFRSISIKRPARRRFREPVTFDPRSPTDRRCSSCNVPRSNRDRRRIDRGIRPAAPIKPALFSVLFARQRSSAGGQSRERGTFDPRSPRRSTVQLGSNGGSYPPHRSSLRCSRFEPALFSIPFFLDRNLASRTRIPGAGHVRSSISPPNDSSAHSMFLDRARPPADRPKDPTRRTGRACAILGLFCSTSILCLARGRFGKRGTFVPRSPPTEYGAPGFITDLSK